MNILKNLGYMARRFKTATVLNLVGLAVAYGSLYLLWTQVDYARSYNRSIPDAERVMRVEAKLNAEADWNTYVARPILEIIEQMPQVEATTILSAFAGKNDIFVGETALSVPMQECNHTPFAAMGTQVVDGELAFTDDDKSGVLMPASLAHTVFGTPMAAGRHYWNGKDSIPVRGVYRDFPKNCAMPNAIYYDMGNNFSGQFSEWSFSGYAKLHEGVDAAALQKDFPAKIRKEMKKLILAEGQKDMGKESLSEEEMAEFDEEFNQYFAGMDFRLRPISETYFSGVDDGDKGNPAMLFILELACVLVVIIAAINFLNFTLAESPMRVKSVNTRRVLGESLSRLRCGLVGEAVVTSVFACLLALALVAGLSGLSGNSGLSGVSENPGFPGASGNPENSGLSSLLMGDVSLGSHWAMAAFLVALSVVVGVVAGAYPARFVTSFPPALVLKGSFGLTPRGRRLRTGLVCLQLLVSLLMVIYMGVLYLQSHYIYNSDYGFAKDEVLYANLTKGTQQKRDALRTELQKIPGVESVGYSRFVLGGSDTYMKWGRADNDHTITFTAMPVDWQYLRTMGIKVVEGRDFNEHDGDVLIINKAARRAWPWVKIDQPLLKDYHPVVGVCEDVRFASMRKDRTADPMAFVIMGESYDNWKWDQLWVVNVRVGANTDKVAARQQVAKALEEIGGEAIDVQFLDQQLEQLYQDEFRFIRQVMVFALICLVITLIGVFCLTMFETEYRRKEIGLRKIMGSSTGEVLRLLCRRYVWLLLVSFVVAAPVAWKIGHEWLLSFTERTPIYWWLFPLALLLVGVVTMATVVIQSWRTANENPIKSIKTE